MVQIEAVKNNTNLSTTDLAHLLNVCPTAIKRWEKRGIPESGATRLILVALGTNNTKKEMLECSDIAKRQELMSAYNLYMALKNLFEE